MESASPYYTQLLEIAYSSNLYERTALFQEA